MNLRPHSDNCLTGTPCRRCYIRKWDKNRRDKNRKNRFTSRKAAVESLSEAEIRQKREKGTALYREAYSAKKPMMLAKNTEWRRANPDKLRKYTANYRAAKLQATPKWADLSKIATVYDHCPKGMEVDHMIPLQGENICGLHVDYNLQYLSLSDNRSKGNRMKVG